MKECWKDIKGYEGIYQVSNTGKIKSLKRTYKNRICKEKIKTPVITPKGYYRVGLCKEGKTKFYYIHRLVAQTFLPNENNLPQVNHKDENKLNNCINNLEWCDNEYNINYGNCNIKRYISRAINYCKYNNKYDIAEELEIIRKKL